MFNKSYKKIFPFRIATTSYIFPDNIIPNVSKLGNFFDEIELVLFESLPPSSLPTEEDIRHLTHLKQQMDITYNVHLPYDIALTDPDPMRQDMAVHVLTTVLKLTQPLDPTTYTLHIPVYEKKVDTAFINATSRQLSRLLDSGIDAGIEPQKISIETLDYPIEWLDPLLNRYDLSVCMDFGHLIRYGYDPEQLFKKYKNKIVIIHLHGVQNKRDHGHLNLLSEKERTVIADILKQFKGILSLEVFSYHNLSVSLKTLENLI